MARIKKHGQQKALFTDREVRRDRFKQLDQQGQLGGPRLDTLAQLPTEDRKASQVTGIKSLENLKKRARQKYFTNALVYSLVDVKVDGNPTPLKKSYWNSFHCVSVLDQIGQTITSRFCNARWCMVCNRVRTAKLVNGYMPQLKALDNKFFVTLTVPNCKSDKLRSTINTMMRECVNIARVIRERRKISFQGIRKLECTYSVERDDYHPHFHLILSSEKAAQEFLAEWLFRFPGANLVAQDIRKADDNSVFELFKYFTKVVSGPKAAQLRKTKSVVVRTGKKMVHVRALDTIFRAMVGKRVFQPLGLPKICEDVDPSKSERYAISDDNAIWTWLDSDWVSKETGEILTQYTPSKDIQSLISDRFVT